MHLEEKVLLNLESMGSYDWNNENINLLKNVIHN